MRIQPNHSEKISETDFEKLLPRLRRFARCLFCDINRADEAVYQSLDVIIGQNGEAEKDVVATEILIFQLLLTTARKQTRDEKLQLSTTFPGEGSRTEDKSIRKIEWAIAELSFEERAVIALHVLEGVGLAETASLMSLATGVANERLQAARTRLVCSLSAMDALDEYSESDYGELRQ